MRQKNKQTRIELPLFSNLWLKITAILNRVLVFFQLREKREYWGIVYDSVSKQPLDPVRVSLIYADTGKVEGSCITDLNGRYGFLARPGKFKIFVQRTNYIFPSKIVKAGKDGIYTHLYHGEFFELNENSEVVAPNIPMDPVQADWNQKAKQNLVWQNFYSKWFLEKFIAVILWFGFVSAAAVAVLTNFESQPALLVSAAYFLIFLLELSTPRFRLWGKILDSKSRRPISGLSLKLANPQAPDVVFGSSTSRADGGFFLRANPGFYLLKISDSDSGEYLGTLPVKIGSEGVLNQKLLVKDFFMV